ncbi:MAG: squalene synthase HpnC [Alphaproteobacteria bacterium]|nr:squalene synthase HpnC [Alphaproteobacteria bacterium]
MSAQPIRVETPSGKGAGDENFPVGSMLLPARLRPHVAKYYAFARAIDDIADNPDLAPEDKVARLDGFDKALIGEIDDEPAFAKAYAIRMSCAETNVPIAHCRDLIVAFKQDAVKLRYRDWDDLMGYCNNSASPVGRYLLDLHGESRDHYRYSDALCNALQVINHLQDCQDDYRNLDRVYLPEPWLIEAGATVADLGGTQSNAGVRQTIERCLTYTERLMTDARRLPGVLRNRRLAYESSAIVRLADTLIDRLHRQDPLARRVELSKPHFLWCVAMGIARALLNRADRSKRHGEGL